MSALVTMSLALCLGVHTYCLGTGNAVVKVTAGCAVILGHSPDVSGGTSPIHKTIYSIHYYLISVSTGRCASSLR